jgi:hypothetical protein
MGRGPSSQVRRPQSRSLTRSGSSTAHRGASVYSQRIRAVADGDQAHLRDGAAHRAASQRGPPVAWHRVIDPNVLGSGLMVWWLLEDGLTARQRVCRMQLLRRNSARELANSIAQVGEDPGVAGTETLLGIEAECRDLGLIRSARAATSWKGRFAFAIQHACGSLQRTSSTRAATASTGEWPRLNQSACGGYSSRLGRQCQARNLSAVGGGHREDDASSGVGLTAQEPWPPAQ